MVTITKIVRTVTITEGDKTTTTVETTVSAAGGNEDVEKALKEVDVAVAQVNGILDRAFDSTSRAMARLADRFRL